jgi:hypothetical protein
VVFADAFKSSKAVPAPAFVVVSDGAIKPVNFLQCFGKTGTRKIVGDAKITDSLDHFINDG